MEKFDYNSSSFKNAAIDKMNTRFGNGTPEKRQMAATSSASLANPFTQTRNPIKQPLVNTTVARPTAPKPAAAGSKPETKPTTPTASAAPSKPAAPKTRKEVKQEVKAKVAAAKGEQKLARIQKRGSMTTEEKMEKIDTRQKRAGNFAKAVEWTLGTVGTAATTYGMLKKD